MRDRFAIGRSHERAPGDRFEQQQVRRARVVPAGDQAVDDAWRATRPEDQIRPACRGCTVPSGSAADSTARVAVVPTAITRPPDARVSSTSRAVVGGTSNGSAAGGSPFSAEETPACRVIGAITIPADDQRRHQLGS